MKIAVTEYKQSVQFASRWLLLGSFVGVLAGIAVAFFVRALTYISDLRAQHLWIIAFLPIGGILSAWIYKTFGEGTEEGNNLIIDEVLEFRGRIRLRMAPIILVATLITHLFGGSAGREGTAVQMAGAIAGKVASYLRLAQRDARMLIMAGIAGGFSAVFGTPVAGAIFGMEVIARGEIQLVSAVACVAAALAANLFTSWVAPVHENYHVVAFTGMSLIMVGKLLLAAIPFALASTLFSELTHTIAHRSMTWIRNDYLRIAIGSLLVLAIWALVRNPEYLGLSIPLLDRALNGEVMPSYAFMLKLILTVVTLGVGFKGGEVTPLFVIGALLGSTLAPLLGFPITTLAAIGFVAVFAAASKTPIACTIMGIEIFGASYAAPLILVNFVCYVLAGHSGIYTSQRIANFGFDHVSEVPDDQSLD
ncbi:MAG: chloride channel protein [Candidatus Kapaibacterium sp.]|jgi:H+/Cl- antiporter ClcA